MKVYCLLILNTLVLNLTSGQINKYYFNEKYESINEIQYINHPEDPTFLKLIYTVDTAIFHLIERREIYGRLDSITHDSIINFISSINPAKSPSTKKVVINYYPGKDDCNATGNTKYMRKAYQEYVKKINRDPHVIQCFIYKDSVGTEKYLIDYLWKKDKIHLIENTFFPLHYPCGSFVIINPDRTYYLYKGEYAFSQIFEKIHE